MSESDEKPLTSWEEVASDPWTLRLQVPGGWLYNVVSLTEDGSQYTNSAVFVPESKP